MRGLALELAGVSAAPARAAGSACHDITMSVPAGGTTAVLGASGAGKTTLLRAIAGLVPLRAGTIRLGDRLLSSLDETVVPERRGVGLVFQHLALWSHVSVREHIAFALRASRRGRGRAAEVRAWMERVELPEHLSRRRPGALSGGERQRLAIARTLAAEPALVLYDEPLGHVDPARRERLRALLRRLARESGHTAIVVSHDPADALELADTAAVLEEGRLVEIGPASAMYEQPQTEAGAQALGPYSLLPGIAGPAGCETRFGVVPWPAEGVRPHPGRPVKLVVRPTQLTRDDDSPVRGRTTDVHAVAGGWRFAADLGDCVVWGETPQRPERGDDIGLLLVAVPAVLEGSKKKGAHA